MEHVGSLEVGLLEKVSLSEKVVLVLLAVEVGAVNEGYRFLPSRRVLGGAITACAIKACAIKAGQGGLGIFAIKADVVEVDSRSCRQGGFGFLKHVPSIHRHCEP